MVPRPPYGIVPDDTVLDAQSLAAIRMPNRVACRADLDAELVLADPHQRGGVAVGDHHLRRLPRDAEAGAHVDVDDALPLLRRDFEHMFGGGIALLASDAVQLYQNLRDDNPFPLICHLGDMYEAFRTVRRLASAPALIIPGHDPLVARCFPALRAETAGSVLRLDVPPLLPVPLALTP